jgi:hypothetical protein
MDRQILKNISVLRSALEMVRRQNTEFLKNGEIC